jgi:hypothetical protein
MSLFLGYGFEAAVSIPSISSKSPSKLTNNIDPITVYTRTNMRTPEEGRKENVQIGVESLASSDA